MSDLLHFQSDLDAALERLMQIDPRLEPLHAQCAAIALRRREGGLKGLLQIVVGQQVSVASARAIWARFIEAYPAMDAAHLATATMEDLQAAGLSRPKIKTIHAVSKAVCNGLDLAELAHQPADQAHASLTALHGIGPWTADIYLMMCLGHRDIFPAGDLAVQIAVQSGLGQSERPKTAALYKLAAQNWSPERTAAAHLFWAYYQIIKLGREGIA